MLIYDLKLNEVYCAVGNLDSESAKKIEKVVWTSNYDRILKFCIPKIHTTRWLGCVETKLMRDHLYLYKIEAKFLMQQ